MRRRLVSMLGIALLLTLGAVVSVGTAAAQQARCSDFPSQAAAQAALPNNPQLDRDRDGIACENNPAPYATGVDRNRVNPADDADTTTTTTMRTTAAATTSPAMPRTGGGGMAGDATTTALLALAGMALVTSAVVLRRRMGTDSH